MKLWALAVVLLSGESPAPNETVKENGWSHPAYTAGQIRSQISRIIICFAGVLAQDDDDISHEKKLCADKTSGELFRLQAGKDNCRDVIQCTAAVSLRLSLTSL